MAHHTPLQSHYVGSYCLAAGRALGLRPRQDALLRIRHGSVWVTLPSQPGDHFLAAGDSLLVKAGDALVMEPWARRSAQAAKAAPAAQESVYLDWDPVPILLGQGHSQPVAAPVYSALNQPLAAQSALQAQLDLASPPPIITTLLIASYDLLTATLANFFLRLGALGGLRAFTAQASAKRAQGRMASCDSMASSGAL